MIYGGRVSVVGSFLGAGSGGPSKAHQRYHMLSQAIPSTCIHTSEHKNVRRTDRLPTYLVLPRRHAVLALGCGRGGGGGGGVVRARV